VRCRIGLLSDTCAISQKEVELITQSETGEPLAGVKIQVIGQGAPETDITDSNGYFRVKIASKGDVRVSLSKPEYPTQDFTINLANDKNTARIIRLTKSGPPKVESLASISPSGNTPSPATSPTQIEEINWNANADNLMGKVGQDFTYLCSPNGTVSQIWGTDFYTSGSSICSAAVHAGIINTKDGGQVRIKIRPGEGFYNGTARNGVVSIRYPSYRGSYTFLNSSGSQIAPEQIQILDWNDNASNLQGKLDQDFTYSCPPNGTIGTIWGTDVYTIDSPICSAAVHAGAITAKDGGKVQIKISPGAEFYNATTRNGVASNRYTRSSWSFRIIK
jgi:hypothetical protein